MSPVLDRLDHNSLRAVDLSSSRRLVPGARSELAREHTRRPAPTRAFVDRGMTDGERPTLGHISGHEIAAESLLVKAAQAVRLIESPHAELHRGRVLDDLRIGLHGHCIGVAGAQWASDVWPCVEATPGGWRR